MSTWVRRAAIAVGLGFGLVVVGATAASADVIDPPGSCFGSGTWQGEGVTRDSTQFKSGDTITIPAKDIVSWTGRVGDGSGTAEREIEGEVQLEIAGIGTAEVDSWGPNSSTKYGNAGEHDYDVPAPLKGIKFKLKGEHRENGQKVCGGSVYLKVKGGAFGNPLTAVGFVLTILSGGSLITSGFVKKV